MGLRPSRDVLWVLALGVLLYLGRPVLIPVALSVLVALLFVPAARGLERFRIPPAGAAALLVLGSLGLVGYGFYRLSGPAIRWMDEAPQTLESVRERLEPVRQPVEQVAQAAEQVERLADTDGGARAGQEVQVSQSPSLSDRVLGQMWKVVTGLVVVSVLVFFLLSTRRLLFRKMLRLMPDHDRRQRGAAAVVAVRERISLYLSTVAMINSGLAVAVGAALWAIGFPSPALWGVAAGILNFIPYLGSITGVTIVAAVGFTTFDGLGTALAGPASYAFLTGLEGMVITPALLGRRLRLNPVAVLLGLLVLGLLWGLVGALLAVPILVALKVAAEHHRRGRRLAILLGR